jgi:hypothetical protein
VSGFPLIGAEIKKPLTLALSRGERGLTAVFLRVTPTWNIESNSGLKSMKIGSLSPSTPWGRGLG